MHVHVVELLNPDVQVFARFGAGVFDASIADALGIRQHAIRGTLDDPFLFMNADQFWLRYDRHVSDQWTPFSGQRREPLVEHVHDLWTLHGIQSTVTAAIWRNDFGLELRVELAGELIESRLSRYGEEPLILIAERAKVDLIRQGWFEITPASDTPA